MNSQLQRFREKHEFCDIFFRVNGTDFDLHRLVLATRMEEFIKVRGHIKCRCAHTSADSRVTFKGLAYTDNADLLLAASFAVSGPYISCSFGIGFSCPLDRRHFCVVCREQAHSSTGRNMRDSGNSADERILFDRLPGGNETFAMVVDFCYGIETFKVRGQECFHPFSRRHGCCFHLVNDLHVDQHRESLDCCCPTTV